MRNVTAAKNEEFFESSKRDVSASLSGYPLRILIILEASSGGAARHTIDLVAELARTGHLVTLAYSPLRATDDFKREIAGLGCVGVHCVAIPMSRGISTIDISALKTLRQLLSTGRPYDVVHAQSTKGILGLLAAKGKCAARIFTPHAFRSLDPDLTWIARAGVGMAEAFFCWLSDQVITVSADEFEFGLNLGVKPHKLRLVHNGIQLTDNPDRHNVRKELGLDDNHLVVGFVGRFSHQKAPERAIEVLENLSKRFGRRVRLVMVGFGEKFHEIETAARNKGVSDQLIVVENGNGKRLMAAFDTLILTSRYEGLPYVLIEGAASKLPIVSLDVGGANSVIKHGYNGYVVNEWDPSVFSRQVELILANPSLQTEMAISAGTQAELFRVEQMAWDTVETYHIARDQCRQRRSPYTSKLKRLIDILGASAGLAVLAPIMAVLYFLVRRDGGPAIFAHERVGRNGKPFHCLKFRTMCVDAEDRLRHILKTDESARQEWESTQKMRNDPRVTKLGKILRKFSLDELPQLVNIIRGEMSIVGPRPIVEEETRYYNDEIEKYKAVRPGLTGLWQVSGRSDLSYRERVALDAKYVATWGPLLDIKIILMTIPAVIKARGVC